MSETLSNGTCVVGLYRGDEAKGRVVDELAASHDGAASDNGGPNAGHTVHGDGFEISTSQLPSNVLEVKRDPRKWMYIGPGAVLDMPELAEEERKIRNVTGFEQIFDRLRIAANVSVIQPHHILLDKANSTVGTTQKGIGWVYRSMCERTDGGRRVDILFGELEDSPNHFFDLMKRNLIAELERLHDGMYTKDRAIIEKIAAQFNVDQRIDAQRTAFEKMKKCVEWDPMFVVQQMRQGQRVLFEGKQSIFLGKKTGTPPYITASDTTPAALLGNVHVSEEEFKIRKIGVTKAFPTAVGYGPAPTEFGGMRSEQYAMAGEGKWHTRAFEEENFGWKVEELLRSGDDFEVGRALRHQTGNYGVRTFRPRRMCYADAFATEKGADMCSIDEVVLTQVDCLQLYRKILGGMRLGVGYKLGGEPIDYFPMTEERLRAVQVIDEHFDPFDENLSDMREQSQLPEQVMKYLRRYQEVIGRPITMAGVGPERTQKIYLNL